MKTALLILGLAIVFMIVALLANPVRAQEATAFPDFVPQGEALPESVQSDDITIEADSPLEPGAAFTAILAMGASVMAAMEMLKAGLFRNLFDSVNSNVYAVSMWAVSLILAFVLLWGLNDPSRNILNALGVFPDAQPIFGQIVTALAISFGNGFLHNLYDFIGKGRGSMGRG